ncbi:hypothetical protein CB1_000243020 [Camelus ferus]|nr:hypothetical protein CB1_000243020 [Camelus ferus]
MLDENHHLIQCILDYQSKGKAAECTQYQQILHRNLVYLATIADSNQNMQSLLPAPPTQSMTLGPGGLSQSGSSQGLHSQGSLSDAIGAGLPPSSLMQAQIGNEPVKPPGTTDDSVAVGQQLLFSIRPLPIVRGATDLGPNHVSMQQTAQSTLPTTSMSMSGSSHGSGPGYSHSGPASQSVPLQGQGTISNYVSRANINMQSNPGSSQQYLGQEEYYGGEQYGHSQAASEPVSQPYYPDGHGDYAYQQSSYPEQSYDRPFEEPTQHYYEGDVCSSKGWTELLSRDMSGGTAVVGRLGRAGCAASGNSQYSQQQAGYQQGTAQQQTYSQQQYPNQQGYPGQQQGYAVLQPDLDEQVSVQREGEFSGCKASLRHPRKHPRSTQTPSFPKPHVQAVHEGAPSQYSGYQQGQGQQYGSYRAAQTGPAAQQQRPYGYEQASLPSCVSVCARQTLLAVHFLNSLSEAHPSGVPVRPAASSVCRRLGGPRPPESELVSGPTERTLRGPALEQRRWFWEEDPEGQGDKTQVAGLA